MIELLSPEYSFRTFCNRVPGTDPMAVVDAACAEASNARRLHIETTKELDFRKGSRGRLYCQNLERLVSMLDRGNKQLTDRVVRYITSGKLVPGSLSFA